MGTRDLSLREEVKTTEVVTPFGRASQTDRLYGKDGSPFQLTLRIKELNDLHAITVQGFLHNRSDEDLSLNSLEILDAMSV